jgi:ubiquinone/menaquinone biosynthesis C-methylase UbiE
MLNKNLSNNTAQAQFYDNLMQKRLLAGERLIFSDKNRTLHYLNRISKRLRGKRVLEIGCGTGYLTQILKEEYKATKVTGIDISPKSIEKAEELYPNNKFEVMRGEKLTFDDESFDVVISIQTIEHIKNYSQHLKEVYRVLKDKGIYLIETPNKPYNVIWEILQGNKDTYKFWHPSLFTKFSLERELRKYKFCPKFLRQYDLGQEKENQLVNKLGILGQLLNLFPLMLLPKFCAPTLFAIAMKNE